MEVHGNHETTKIWSYTDQFLCICRKELHHFSNRVIKQYSQYFFEDEIFLISDHV